MPSNKSITRAELLVKIGASLDADAVASLETKNDEEFGRWLIWFFRDDLAKQAHWLSREFQWLAKRYGEDISPDTVLNKAFDKLISKAHVFALYSNPLAGMRITMYNVLRDLARRLRRGGEPVALDQEELRDEILESLTGPSGHVRVQQDEKCELLERLLAIVESDQSRGVRILRMYYFDGLNKTQIASMEGIHHVTVGRHIQKTLNCARKEAATLGLVM